MKLYHYTNSSYWQEIKQGGAFIGHTTPGLIPLRRLGREYDPAYTRTAVFLLLEPKPINWIRNKHFPDVWKKFNSNTGNLLLEATVDDPEKFSVLDWGHMEGHLSKNPEYLKKKGKNIPKRYIRESRVDAEKAYIESEVPLSKYLESPTIQEDYSVPEVITSELIPIENIRVYREQPKLLDSKGRPVHDYARRMIKDIPELAHFLA